jgi:hypothetical protein
VIADGQKPTASSVHQSSGAPSAPKGAIGTNQCSSPARLYHRAILDLPADGGITLTNLGTIVEPRGAGVLPGWTVRPFTLSVKKRGRTRRA